MGRACVVCASIAVGAAIVLAAPTSVAAQRLGGQRFAPAGSEDGVLGTEGADRRLKLQPYVALWAHYALDPVVLVDEDGDRTASLVEHAFAADVVASVAVWRGLELGVRLPVTLFSDGDDVAAQSSGAPSAPGLAGGDIVLRAGYRLQVADDTAVALHVPVLLPTSASNDPLALGLGVRPTVAVMQRLGRAELLFNLSYLFRKDAEAVDYKGGQEIAASVASRVALDSLWRTAVLAELRANTPVRAPFEVAETPVEVRVGAEHWLAAHWRLTGLVGTGLSRGVGAPDLRAGVSVAYGYDAPFRPRPESELGDRDGDGIADDIDACPAQPEDVDGFEDDDGCPDPDNDRDGILDVVDECPRAPESFNGTDDDDGCPDRVRLDPTEITTLEPVHFKTDSDEIHQRSYEMLREVAAVLEANPHVNLRVEGHTDDRGPAAHNLELSQRRADSVRRFLVEQGGVAGSRIEAKGYGEERPIATNDTPAGRAKNRRVQFHILEGR